MNSYDDYEPYGGHDEPATGRASVGRASVGRASVPGAVSPPPAPAYGEPYGAPYGGDPHGGEPTYGAPYGSGPSYADPYASGGEPAGGYGIPTSPPVVGRSVVGRASVRPVSPSGPQPGEGGRGRGPGGPGGRGPWNRPPWRRGPGDDGGRGEGGGGGPEGRPRRRPDARDPKKAKLARRRNIIIAAFAVFIMLTGVGVVGGTYYVDSVPTPDQLSVPESTKVYYSDGKTVMATLGTENRTIVDSTEISDAVKQAIIAAEDQTFYQNDGVDFKGVMRAAWNNFTGGETQGASTITQQYARQAAELTGVTYSRKLREAVMAWKLDDKWSKEYILAAYLNTIYFGRGAYGVEAAAQAYFGKTVNKKAPAANQVTRSEAMVLAAIVKQPEPEIGNEQNSPGFDPGRGEKALANSKGRWEYVREGLVKLNYIQQSEADALKYPETMRPYDPKGQQAGLTLPTGLVVQHALSELRQSQVFAGRPKGYIENGGFTIVTTINKAAQDAAVKAADETVKGSALYGQPANLQAALVGVEPGTGRILAYFGGHDGSGSDYAGWYMDEDGTATGYGAHSAGSSFKVYDLAAALKDGISVKTYWDATSPKEFPQSGRGKTNPVRNSSTAKCQPVCTLIEATVASLNVPFFALTETVSAAKVIEMARAAGIDFMWNDKRERIDLRNIKRGGEVAPSEFSTEVGIGQYPVTVMDHANGMATFAADGLRAQAHFVKEVRQDGKVVYSERLPTGKEPRVLSQAGIDDLSYVLSQVPSGKLNNGWNSAGKTGTWQYGQSTADNAHAWMVGYTKKLAAAVWVGNKKEEKPLRLKDGKTKIFGSGVPATIWRSFMTEATKAMALKRAGFSEPRFIGDDTRGNTPSPVPSLPPWCQFPGFCPSEPPGGGGGPGGGGPGGGNNDPKPLPTVPPPRVNQGTIARE